jgi:hypothetical protein
VDQNEDMFQMCEVLKNTEIWQTCTMKNILGKNARDSPISHTENSEFKRKIIGKLGPKCVCSSMPSCDGPKLSFLHISKN